MSDLIKDLALILVVAGAVTLIFKKLKQPLVLGYIVAGFLVSPHMPYTMSVIDKADIQTWADIGVLFLLFSLGLDFSFKKILKMGMSPVIAALTIVFCMMSLGICVGHAFGWQRMDCIFLGGMLAMSSTTIIYKAFDDMGLRQQRFASLVMSVLILEDILAIVMMVMLSAIAAGNSPDGSQMIGSVLKIGFFLILWFVIGIFAIPLFLRSTRKLMNEETLVVVAIGLCCAMAVISTQVGFSSAFGAFVMGSIFAETIEAESIIKVVEPVKNLFGAVFFVSVGMLVDPQVLVKYALPILALVLTIVIGQCIFGTIGYMLGGQPLKTAIRCGFSMAQIGEFAFIIASLGLSLGVISDFLYPVVVAVSVITTFLTPYMIRAAEPCYNLMEQHLPKKWVRRLNRFGGNHTSSAAENSLWRKFFSQIILYTLIYCILSVAVIFLIFSFVLPRVVALIPSPWTSILVGVLTILIISPFLRAMIMKGNHNSVAHELSARSRLNWLPLAFSIIVRIVIAAAFIFYIINRLTHFTNALIFALAAVAIILIILSRRLKTQTMLMERTFLDNLRSRDTEARVHGRKRPLFEQPLQERDIHISDFQVPENSAWAGQTLQDLQLRSRFGVDVSSILRGKRRINTPGGTQVIFPGDRLQAIGDDDQLSVFAQALKTEIVADDPDIEKREMILRQVTLSPKSPLVGKKLAQSGLRDKYGCMVVGIEEGQKNLTQLSPQHVFEVGDNLWIVGEKDNLDQIEN